MSRGSQNFYIGHIFLFFPSRFFQPQHTKYVVKKKKIKNFGEDEVRTLGQDVQITKPHGGIYEKYTYVTVVWVLFICVYIGDF